MSWRRTSCALLLVLVAAVARAVDWNADPLVEPDGHLIVGDVSAPSERFERSLADTRRQFGKNAPEVADLLHEFGWFLYANREHERAEALLREALRIRRARHGARHPRTTETRDTLIGVLELRMGMGNEAAEVLYREAWDADRRALGALHPATIDSLDRLARSVFFSGEHGRMEETSREVLRLRRQAFGDRDTSTLLSMDHLAMTLEVLAGEFMSWDEHDGARLAEAERLWRQALALRRQTLGDAHAETIESFQRLATLLERQDRDHEAEEWLSAALAGSERLFGADHEETAHLRARIAACREQRGEYASAEPLRYSVVQTQERYIADLDRRLTDLRAWHDKNPDANPPGWTSEYNVETFIWDVADLRHAASDHLSSDLDSLATNLEAQDRHGEAEPLRWRALSLSRETRINNWQSRVVSRQRALARNLSAQHRYREAEAILREALFTHHTSDTAQARAAAAILEELTNNLFDQERLADAEPVAAALVAALRGIGGPYPDHMRLQLALTDLAFTQIEATKDSAAAVANMREAMTISRARRAYQIKYRDREAEADEMRYVFHVFADAAWEHSRQAPSERAALARESFAALQNVSAGRAAQALTQAGARFSAGNDALGAIVRRYQDLEQESLALAAQMKDLPRNMHYPRLADELSVRRKRIGERLNALDNDLKKRFPRYFDLIQPEPLNLAELQQLLKPDEALLLISPGLFGTHVMAVSRTRFSWERTEPSRAEISDRVARLHCDLLPDCTDPLAGARTLRTRGSQNPSDSHLDREYRSFDRATAYELYRNLVAPVLPVLQDVSSLYIVASDELASLPFSVLLTEPPAPAKDDADPEVLRNAPWLIDRFALTQLPSVGSLRAVRERRRPPGVRPFLGFGDPILKGTPGGIRSAVTQQVEPSSAVVLADAAALREFLPPLPGTQRELEAARLLMGADAASVYLAERATEAAFKSAPLANTRHILVASHALRGGEFRGIVEPGIVFTPPSQPTVLDDGYLTASEAAQLTLNTEWLILSACDTASGDGSEAEALGGLARAFFYAGARTLMVSQWAVRDDVAEILIPEVLRLAQAQSERVPALTRAQALQRATQRLRMGELSADESLAHPAAWAPFTLVGEGGR